MAHIGMKYPVAATWTEGNKYADGFVLAKAINFTGTPNKMMLIFGRTME
ncbi:MAG: hypothetical protein ACLTER_12455 [Ruminococcus sp.]